jgi:hypothetical protein
MNLHLDAETTRRLKHLRLAHQVANGHYINFAYAPDYTVAEHDRLRAAAIEACSVWQAEVAAAYAAAKEVAA